MTTPDRPAGRTTGGQPDRPIPDEEVRDRRLDGNAAAGPLRELFALDLMTAACTCAHCGATTALAEHVLYPDAPALVLRCPSCTGVVLRYGTGGGRARLDLTGARLLVLDLDGEVDPTATAP
jgi:hypothetical protein